MTQSFTCAGTSDYIAAPDLMQTVNVAVQLSRPLLIKGEPGTGKTMLAQSIACGAAMAPSELLSRDGIIWWSFGSVTIRKVREVFPMFELTVDGLTAATKKLTVRY